MFLLTVSLSHIIRRISTPDLVPSSDASLTGTSTPGKTQPPGDGALPALLIKAYTQAAENLHEQWVPIPHLGAVLKRLDPEFRAKVYGSKDLPTFVQSCSDLFLTRKQTTGKTKHVEVRLVTGK
jgi:OST-HTH/LOTUS domain